MEAALAAAADGDQFGQGDRVGRVRCHVLLRSPHRPRRKTQVGFNVESAVTCAWQAENDADQGIFEHGSEQLPLRART